MHYSAWHGRTVRDGLLRSAPEQHHVIVQPESAVLVQQDEADEIGVGGQRVKFRQQVLPLPEYCALVQRRVSDLSIPAECAQLSVLTEGAK